VHNHLQNEEDISPVAPPAAPSPASPFWRGRPPGHSITGASLLSLIFFYHFIPNCFSSLSCSAAAGANRRWSRAAAAGSGARRRGREDGDEGAGLAAAHGHSALDPNGGRPARSQDPAVALPRVHRRQRPREAQGLEKASGGGTGTEAE
jgi:hypothetical protein